MMTAQEILKFVWGSLNSQQREELLKILTDMEKSEEKKNDA